MVISPQIRGLVNTLSPGAFHGLTKIDLDALDNVVIKPIGIYGSKQEITRYLQSKGAINDEVYVSYSCLSFTGELQLKIFGDLVRICCWNPKTRTETYPDRSCDLGYTRSCNHQKWETVIWVLWREPTAGLFPLLCRIDMDKTQSGPLRATLTYNVFP